MNNPVDEKSEKTLHSESALSIGHQRREKLESMTCRHHLSLLGWNRIAGTKMVDRGLSMIDTLIIGVTLKFLNSELT